MVLVQQYGIYTRSCSVALKACSCALVVFMYSSKIVFILVQSCMVEPLGWCWYSMGMIWYVVRYCGIVGGVARYDILYVDIV